MADPALSVRVPEHVKAHLEHEATRDGTRLSDHVRSILERHVQGGGESSPAPGGDVSLEELLADLQQVLGELRLHRQDFAEHRLHFRRAVKAIILAAATDDFDGIDDAQVTAWLKKNFGGA